MTVKPAQRGVAENAELSFYRDYRAVGQAARLAD